MAETLGLTDLQVDLMRVLWARGEATVVEVHRELNKVRALAQPTVATLLSRLEKKGAVGHRMEGRQFVYSALVTEAEVRRSMLSQLTESFFGGDVPTLIHQLLSEHDVPPSDLAAVKAMIERHERTAPNQVPAGERKVEDDER